MFSVVIPLYNKSAYIIKAVESVLKQTLGEFELIIINDGSTDDSLNKVQSFVDTRIKIFTQQNGGVSIARNKGVSLASYEYIALLDADDWWDISFLQEMKTLIRRYPDAGFYASNYYYVKNRKLIVEQKGLPRNFFEGYLDFITTYSRNFCSLVNCSFVIVPKRIFVEQQGFKEELKFGEDIDLWIRIALRHKLGYINKPLAYSNQDVLETARAIGGSKIYPVKNFFIFNMQYLELEEEKNRSLKRLLDGLRVRTLLKYYLTRSYEKETKKLLLSVNFREQPLYFKLLYHLPVPFAKLLLLANRLKTKLQRYL